MASTFEGASAHDRTQTSDDPSSKPVDPAEDLRRIAYQPDDQKKATNMNVLADNSPAHAPAGDKSDREPKIWTVLSIDGGGIRGMIPAEVLSRLEQKTGLRTTEMFDLVTGTSVGGILAAGLTKPGADGKQQYSAADMVKLFESDGHNIFSTNKLFEANSLKFGGPKYPSEGINSTLAKYFGDCHYRDQLGKVVIPSFDTTTSQPIFFKNWEQSYGDALTRTIARATSAAPMFFSPVRFGDNGALIDGGAAANNPAMVGYAEITKFAKPGDQIVVVSLGTGRHDTPRTYDELSHYRPARWLQPASNYLFWGPNDATNYALAEILNHEPASSSPDGAYHPERGFFRFQSDIDTPLLAIDDASPSNLKHLKELGDRVVDVDQKSDFDTLAKELVEIHKYNASRQVAADSKSSLQQGETESPQKPPQAH